MASPKGIYFPIRSWAIAILFIVFVVLRANAQSGTIKGRVVDASTSQPLPYASIYFNNTTLGTVTAVNGEFNFTDFPFGDYELIVSYVGYRPYSKRISVNDTKAIPVYIRLIPYAVNLAEVAVKSQKDSQWNRNLERFKKLFFGQSPYTSACKIYNPWVLDFQEDKNGNLLAKADAPLDIENRGLGYRITYQLTGFTAGQLLFNISGYVRFQELGTADTVLSALWSSRREQTYRASPRHLFNAMIENEVERQGFRLYEDISETSAVVRKAKLEANLYQSIVPYDTIRKNIDSLNQHVILTLPSRLEVHYLGKKSPATIYGTVPNPISWVEVKGGSLVVNEDGVVLTPANLTLSGAMGQSRVAEILPYDYTPLPDQTYKAPTQNIKCPLAPLVEQPYLHTDKSYYYRGDLINYKVYMNYVTNPIRDSLSHVLYVDLYNRDKGVVARNVVPLNDATANGNIELPTDIPVGDYQLRSYTQWMLNFDEHFVFVKPIKILENNELVRPYAVIHEQDTSRIHITSKHESYEPREKITLSLITRDFLDYAIASNLSISVTDISQASAPKNEMTILNTYKINEEYLPDTSFQKPLYAIQYGINFSGRMVSKRGKPTDGVLTIFQEKVKDVFTITPDNDEGVFKRVLQFPDTTEFLIQARTSSGLRAIIEMDENIIPSPTITSSETLDIDVYTTSDPTRYHIPYTLSGATILDEVVVVEGTVFKKNSREENLLKTDFTIDGEWLRERHTTDLLSAIQAKVPGLRVMSFYSEGMVKKFLAFPSASFGPTQECLVEVDGIVLDGSHRSVADQLADMNVTSIESINFIKYGMGASYGARGANGVIIVKTTTGPTEEHTPRIYNPKKLQVVTMAGFSTPKDVYFPDYSDSHESSSVPDTRSTIYWNPNILTSSKEPGTVSFYAGSVPTQYRIVVEGIDVNGEPVRGEKILTITSP